MSKKPETVFRERVEKKLKLLPNSWFESIQQKSIRGTPDKIGCIRGFFVALEFKKDFKTNPEELQKYKIHCIHNAMGIALVVHPYNWDDTYKFLKIFAEGTNV